MILIRLLINTLEFNYYYINTSNDETFEVIGRFFFKVPNDTTSLAERKSLNYFINWIESVYLQVSGTDLPCQVAECRE